MWFSWPLHYVDDSDEMATLVPQGSAEANLMKSSRRNYSQEKQDRDLEKAFEVCSIETPVTVQSVAKYLGVTERTVRNRIEKSEIFCVKYGCVLKNDVSES